MMQQPKASNQHFSLFVWELSQPLIQHLGKIFAFDLSLRATGSLSGNRFNKALFILGNRNINRGYTLTETEDLQHIGHRLIHLFGNFFRCWGVIETLREFTRGAHIDIEFFDYMHRQSNGAGLIHQPTLNSLPNPPGCVGGETIAQLRIELLYRTHKANIALFD